MNKVATFVLFALIAVAVASEVTASSDVTEDKRKNNKYIAKVRVHITHLLAKIHKEQGAAALKAAARKKHCKKWIGEHARVAKKARHTSKVNAAAIVANKKVQHEIATKLVPEAEKKGVECDKHKEALQKKMDTGDANRKEAQEKYDHEVKRLSRHLKFVKGLYLYLMKSTVERRRNVGFLEEKAKAMHQHATELSGKAATLMETGASMLVTGHLDAVYRLLDNLRGELQRQIRSKQRKEMAAARAWVRLHARLRAKQIHWHKKSIRWSVRASKLELKEEKLDLNSEERQRTIENNDLIADHRERDLDILKVRCRRAAFSYKNRVHQWKDEVAALKGLRAKINGYYTGGARR